MTSPANLAMGSLAGNAAGGILGAFGKFAEGSATSDMYNYRAGVALANRQIALQNADYAIGAGEQSAMEYGLKAGQTKGAIRAAQGASGLDVGGQSATDVRTGQDLKTKFDESTIRNNAARVAYGYQVEASQDEAQSNLDKMAASKSKTAGIIGGMGSLISGATGVADKWLQMGQYGIGSAASNPLLSSMPSSI